MKLNFGSEAIMLIFILGLLFFTVVQPTFYPSYSTPPAGRPTSTPTPPAGGATPTPTVSGSNPAFFTIAPLTSTIKKGETLTLTFVLDTGDYEIDTVDLVLNFDPRFLQTDPGSIGTGTIFPEYTVQKVEGNRIQVSAAGEIQPGQVIGFRGEGVYAQIDFLALQATNSTQVSFNNDCLAISDVNVNRLDLSKCQAGNYQIID